VLEAIAIDKSLDTDLTPYLEKQDKLIAEHNAADDSLL